MTTDHAFDHIKPKFMLAAVFLPGTWSDRHVAEALTKRLTQCGIACKVLWGEEEESAAYLRMLPPETVIIAHSFGAYRACRASTTHRMILWNPVGILDHLNRWGWWWAVVFKFRVLGRFCRLLWGTLRDDRTRWTERDVASHIHWSMWGSRWTVPLGHCLLGRETHIVYSRGDAIIPYHKETADTVLDKKHGHAIRDAETLCRVVQAVLRADAFTRKTAVTLGKTWTTPIGTFWRRR
ncbi:hypothetical protein EBZ80_16005 [bacterium]|nr:hypothetical protein [bacterium]